MNKKPILIVIGVLLGALLVYGVFAFTPKTKSAIVNSIGMEPTIAKNQKIKYTTDIDTIRRGDIVVYKHDGKSLFYRVAGLPGERIVISSGELKVYSQVNSSGFAPAELAVVKKFNKDIDLTLGNDEYYVVGDNQPNALDSTMTGPVKRVDIFGLVVF